MCNISCLAPQTTAVYECDACGAQFSENEYSSLLRTDEDGFTDAKCPFCGGMSFSDQYRCRYCDEFKPGAGNSELPFYGVCTDCLIQAIDQYNRAFDGLPEDVKTILCDVMGEMKIDMEVFK